MVLKCGTEPVYLFGREAKTVKNFPQLTKLGLDCRLHANQAVLRLFNPFNRAINFRQSTPIQL